MICGILIADDKWNIGNNGNKIIDIPTHEAFIKEKIKGHPVVIGFNYFIKNKVSPIEGASKTYVVCPELVDRPNCICVHSLKDLIKLLKEETDDVYVLGGHDLFLSMLPFIEYLYVTRVSGILPATSSLPPIDSEPYKYVLVNEPEYKVFQEKIYQFEEYLQLIRN